MPCFEPEELAAWCGGQWSCPPAAALTGISHDTRTIQAGNLYVALVGERFDGHTFVPQALAQGAGAALVNKARPDLASARPLLEVEDTDAALLRLGTGYRRKIAPRIVGITGSVGKTTVKEMTAAVLSAGWRTERTRGNWNNHVGLPLSLLQMAPDTEMGVFELGMNHPGEIVALSRALCPDWGIVTAIGAAHIGFFSSVDEIAREKASLLESLPAAGRAFLDARGDHFELLKARSSAPVVTVALSGEADYRCISHDGAVERFTVRETRTGDECEFCLPSPGRHNMLNALFAIAVGREAGMAWDAIRRGLTTCQAMPLRWQRQRVGDVIVINDAYNANPVSMRAAIDTFGRMVVEGARWLVLGDMKELGVFEDEEHRRLGRDIAAGPWAGLLLVGPAAKAIGAGAAKAGYPCNAIHELHSTAECADLLADVVSAGDAVFLKASRSVHLEEIVELLGSTLEVRQ